MTALNHDNFVPRPTVSAANRDDLHAWCDLARGVEAFRGRWKPSILMALGPGPRRLPDLRAVLPGPARRVLVRALREWQADGLIARSGPDLRPNYALTPDGLASTAIFADLAGWSQMRRSPPSRAD